MSHHTRFHESWYRGHREVLSRALETQVVHHVEKRRRGDKRSWTHIADVHAKMEVNARINARSYGIKWRLFFESVLAEKIWKEVRRLTPIKMQLKNRALILHTLKSRAMKSIFYYETCSNFFYIFSMYFYIEEAVFFLAQDIFPSKFFQYRCNCAVYKNGPEFIVLHSRRHLYRVSTRHYSRDVVYLLLLHW